MCGARSTTGAPGGPSGGTGPRHARHVLIVEPEELVRWSLVTYLAKWFDVLSTDTQASADRILDDQQIDAVVVSDDLSNRAAEAIAAHARSRNPTARVVRTVTSPPSNGPQEHDTPCLEKPFKLAEVASLLGVSDPLSCDDRSKNRPSTKPRTSPP